MEGVHGDADADDTDVLTQHVCGCCPFDETTNLNQMEAGNYGTGFVLLGALSDNLMPQLFICTIICELW